MAQLKDLIVTGASRVIGKSYASEFIGSLSGNASTCTLATSVKDSYNGSTLNITYGKAGQSSTSWLASWNGNELGCISPSKITAGAATKLATARTISLTGSVTGSGSFDGSGNLSISTSTNHSHSYAGSSSAGGSATSAVKLDTSSAGSATQPVYFSGGKPVACSYTLGKSVPSNAVFTDTNTWRPLGTTADTACAGNDSRLSDARPASDVYSWAKASTKPSYSWSEITSKPSSFTPASHTHSYAGSSSAGGSATSAVKLDTSSAGSATQPVYFSGGKPVACTYTLGKSVPSNAVFTDTNTWRGIQNNLTSDSTSDSLSAAQGKILKGLVDGKLAKTTYEYNKELAIGSSGKVCIGKFPCYDSNISVEIKSTTNTTYNGTLIIATQNINTSLGGAYKCVVYGDENNTLTSSIQIGYVSGSNVFSVYINLPPWSKNILHIQCVSLAGSPTDIATIVDSIPSTATIIPINAFTHSHNSVNDINSSATTTFAYSKAGLGYSDYSWLAAWNGYELRAVSKSQFATASHTHNYAGSSSAGGAANNAIKDSAGQQINTTYIKGLSVSGRAITYTRAMVLLVLLRHRILIHGEIYKII